MPTTRSLADERVVVTPHVAGLTDVTYREICVGPAAAAVAILAGNSPTRRVCIRMSEES